MKGKYTLRFIGMMVLINLFSAVCTASNTQGESERDRLFNTGWKFIRDSVSGAEQPGHDDSKWLVVDLPHDYSIMALPVRQADLPAGQAGLPGEDGPDQIGLFSKKSPGNGNSTGHVIGGTGWYRKSFTLDKTDEGKTVLLNFDGVYMETEVWVNGKIAGIHKNGYTPFWFDITSLLNATGKVNVIAVKVDNVGRNSRWYSGSGIYRNVHLTITQPVHVAVWGVQITTPEIRPGSALVDIAAVTKNETGKEVKAQITISIKDKDGRLAGTAKENIIISGRADQRTKKQIEVTNPVLWSLESPNLYNAEIIIEVNGKLTDRYSQPFGIRSIAFSAEQGFLLNGKSVELKGGCLHHDNGLLGSAAFDRAEERRVEIMKANGYNAIRCAHNPPSSTFLDACDRLGMLVIDEFTDMWEYYKNPQDYSRFFRQWWNADLTRMILRDRNHPSIIMWSIGNEIYARSDTSLVRIGKQLAGRVRELDPSRVVTQALTEFLYPEGWDKTEPAFTLLDVGGYNYGQNNYEPDHVKHPERVIYASESYPIKAFEYWKPVEEHPWIIGDFVWSAMDYLGEVGIGGSKYVPGSGSKALEIPAGLKIPRSVHIFDMQVKSPSAWPSFVAGCGDIDITGEKKPQMLYRDILWNNSRIEINVHAPIPEGYGENINIWGWPDEWPSWNLPAGQASLPADQAGWKGNEGKPLQVRVFTKASKVRLELNGNVMGEKTLTADDKYIAVFEVPYQPGELKAIAIENGKETANKVLKTSGEAAGIRLIADRSAIHADRNDLSFVTIEVIDKNGLVVPDATIKVKLTLTGNGELAATGNASPNDMESVNKPVIKTYKGKAQAIVRPFAENGTIKLIADSQGLKSGELTLQVQSVSH
jgi:beta-galactosidase